MPKRSSYPPGTPCWVDLETTDQAPARAFYGDLFGWDFEDRPTGDGGLYSMALTGGGIATAIGPRGPVREPAGGPPVWRTYLAVDDVDAATARVAGAGGRVVAQPYDVNVAGRTTLVLDPAGAAVALWQAGRTIGATVVNEHGALVWNELTVPDPAAVTPFYERVAGIGAKTQDYGNGEAYTTLEVDGRSVAGVVAGEPPHWQVYFGADDVAAIAARAAALGGTVLAGPSDTPVGPVATIRDPWGTVFSVFATGQAPQ